MLDPNTQHDEAWEAALEETFNRFEQGEAVSEAQFAELIAELEERHARLSEAPQDDPSLTRLSALRERASRLEASAAKGTGPTDQVSSILGGLTGSNASAQNEGSKD